MRQAALKSALHCEITSRQLLGPLWIGSNAYTRQVDGNDGGWPVGLMCRIGRLGAVSLALGNSINFL